MSTPQKSRGFALCRLFCLHIVWTRETRTPDLCYETVKSLLSQYLFTLYKSTTPYWGLFFLHIVWARRDSNPDFYCVIIKSHLPMLPIRPFSVFLLRFWHFSGA